MNINKKKVSASTTRRRAASLKEFALFIGQAGLLANYKLPIVPEADPHPLPGLKKDLDAMLLACKNDNQRALVALLGFEGLRLHEALELPIVAINVQDMTIKVWGKGSKERVIPITNLAWEFIVPQLIFRKLAGCTTLIEYSDRGARAFITELGARARVSRPVASHDLRATFATLAYHASGNDIRLVQSWLGHADVTTTQGYIGVRMEDMKKAGEF